MRLWLVLTAPAQRQKVRLDPQTYLFIGRQAIARQPAKRCTFRELGLNMRIKPRQRLQREKSKPLAIRVDNGPMDRNANVERYIHTVRAEWPGRSHLENIEDVQEHATRRLARPLFLVQL